MHTTSLEGVEIVPAELGTWAGAIGAAIHGAEQAEAGATGPHGRRRRGRPMTEVGYQPQYRQIEQALRERIATLPPGDGAVRHRAVRGVRRVSRMTARNAMQRLADDGLGERASPAAAASWPRRRRTAAPTA